MKSSRPLFFGAFALTLMFLVPSAFSQDRLSSLLPLPDVAGPVATRAVHPNVAPNGYTYQQANPQNAYRQPASYAPAQSYAPSYAQRAYPQTRPQASYYGRTQYAPQYASSTNEMIAPMEEVSPSDVAPLDDNKFMRAMSQPWSVQNDVAACGAGMCEPVCEPCCPCPVWLGSVRALYMNRDTENPQYFSYDDTDSSIQLLPSDMSSWAVGGEVRLGRSFCCGTMAIEGVYWGIYPEMQEASLHDANQPGFINSTFDTMSRLLYDNGVLGPQSLDTFTDAAQQHRIRNEQEFHNVELNFIYFPVGTYGGSCYLDGACGKGGGKSYCGKGGKGACGAGGVNVGLMAGLRYFVFDEHFQFAASRWGANFGDDPTGEVFYDIDVENRLIGPQIGFNVDYCVTNRLSLFLGSKAGVFNNSINHVSQIYGHNGFAYVDGGPNAGEDFNVHSSKNQISFLGEIDFGARYHLTSHWRLIAGYRIVAMTGMALTGNQVPPHFAGIEDVYDVDTNGEILLHGGYAGVEFAW